MFCVELVFVVIKIQSVYIIQEFNIVDFVGVARVKTELYFLSIYFLAKTLKQISGNSSPSFVKALVNCSKVTWQVLILSKSWSDGLIRILLVLISFLKYWIIFSRREASWSS